jgi:protein-arginine kinase activator protein McsA
MAVKTTTFCDICGNETNDSVRVEVRWCNANKHEVFDVCEHCKYQGSILATEDELNGRKDGVLRGIVRYLFKKKKEQVVSNT